MNQVTDNSLDLLPKEPHRLKQVPPIYWSENTQQRFQSKLYTYSPKTHKIKKRQPLIPCDIQLNEQDLQIGTQLNQSQMILQPAIEGEQKKLVNEGSDVDESVKRDSQGENKATQDDKRQDKGDTKELTPIPVSSFHLANAERLGLISSKISLMSESDCSQWVDTSKLKRKSTKKDKKVCLKKSKKVKKRGRRKQASKSMVSVKPEPVKNEGKRSRRRGQRVSLERV